jgi:hypothetical protein
MPAAERFDILVLGTGKGGKLLRTRRWRPYASIGSDS